MKQYLHDIARRMLDNYVTLDEAILLVRDAMEDEALARAAGNVSMASRRLGVHRNTLHNDIRAKQTGVRRTKVIK